MKRGVLRKPAWINRRGAARLARPAGRAYHRKREYGAKRMSQVEVKGTGRTAYLVLGMHRSGTSAATQLLALAGARLPENVMPGDEHNAKGYFEPWKVAMFNNERLNAAGSAWDDVFAYPQPALPEAEERAWIDRAKAIFEEEYGGVVFPLLKDPRVTVLGPLWRQALDEMGVAARCVIPVRHPLAVAGSLARRDQFPVEKSLLLWSAYMLASEAYTRGLPRVFVGYDSLLSDWRAETARIEASHGAALPALTPEGAAEIDRFLTADLRHNAGDGDLAPYGRAGAVAQAVHDWFAAAAQDRAPPAAALEAQAAELARMKTEFGVLVSPVTRDLDQTRSELLALRQRYAWLANQMHTLEAVLDRAAAQT